MTKSGARVQAPRRRLLLWGALGALLVIVAFVRLPPLFRGDEAVDPVLIAMGPLSIRWYGALIAASFIPGFYLAAAEAERKGYTRDQVADFVLWVAIGGLVGARLGFVLQNIPYFLAHPARIFAAWEGGLSMHGVMAGGIIAALLFTRRYRLPFLPLADATVPALLLGQAIGRWGNFFNQELFGYPTDVPWKMYIRPENRPPAFADYEFFHPTFLYESLWNAAGVLFLLAYRRRPGAREGDVFFLYFPVYSLGRFLVEFFRIEPPFAAGLTLAQWVSLGLMAAGIAFTLIRREERPLTATYRLPKAR